MTALYVILAIIAFFVILFSVKFTLYLTYDSEFKVDVRLYKGVMGKINLKVVRQ